MVKTKTSTTPKQKKGGRVATRSLGVEKPEKATTAKRKKLTTAAMMPRATMEQDASESGRLDEVEKSVKAMKEVTDRLDLILSLGLIRGSEAETSKSPEKAVSSSTLREAEAPIPPPPILRAQQNEDGSIEREFAREAYRAPRIEGKSNLWSDPYIDALTPKPYMYVEREGAATLSQKLNNRTSLEPMEYMLGLLSVLREDRKGHKPMKEQLVEHIFEVAEDSLILPWSTVRKYSQDVFDEIEKGKLAWDNHAKIQAMRLRATAASGPRTVKSTGGKPSQGPGSSGQSHGHPKEVACKDFNQERGCRHAWDHFNNNIKFMHICVYCWGTMGRSFSGHTLAQCERVVYDSAGNSSKGFSMKGPRSETSAPPKN